MITLQDIRAAADVLAGQVNRTVCQRSRVLSKMTGAEVYLKFENFQFTASFKERGALNKLASLTETERQAGVVAMSAGNHAQAVAYHAGRLGSTPRASCLDSSVLWRRSGASRSSPSRRGGRTRSWRSRRRSRPERRR